LPEFNFARDVDSPVDETGKDRAARSKTASTSQKSSTSSDATPDAARKSLGAASPSQEREPAGAGAVAKVSSGPPEAGSTAASLQVTENPMQPSGDEADRGAISAASAADEPVVRTEPRRSEILADTRSEKPVGPALESPPEGAPEDELDVIFGQLPENGGDAPAARKKRGKGPLIGFSLLVLLLLGISYLWFAEPFPDLKKKVYSIFEKKKEVVRKQPSIPPTDTALKAPTRTADTDSAVATPQREWNYFLQVASRQNLGSAQGIGNKFRRMNIPVIVEGEYIASKRRTFYRVRIGPFESAERALRKGDSLGGAVPQDAFIDSSRVEYSASIPRTAPVIQPENRGASMKKPNPPASAPVNPAGGFAVQVSSHRDVAAAQAECRRLLTAGYPAHPSKSATSTGTWYRVYVGPFSTREEARRYQEKLKGNSGNDGIIVDFQKGKSR
jgi:cell division septation protein DedD